MTPRTAVIVIVALIAAAAIPAYQLWEAAAQRAAVAKALTRGDPRKGPSHMRRYGCAGCHTIPGVAGADGKVAPPLSDLRARVYVGGVARNTPEDLVRWIVSPQSFSPQSAMPATGISEVEARDVAAYLYGR